MNNVLFPQGKYGSSECCSFELPVISNVDSNALSLMFVDKEADILTITAINTYNNNVLHIGNAHKV